MTGWLRLPGPFLAAIFDLDGLLIDSEDTWAAAEQELLASYGESMTAEDRRATRGRSIDESARIYAKRVGCLRPDRLRLELTELVRPRFREVRPTLGAQALLECLDGRVLLGLASNSPRELVLPALETCGWTQRFDAITTAADVHAPKPSPDVYLAACRSLRVTPERAFGLEDSSVGLEALRRAGLTAVGVQGGSDADLSDADYIASDLVALLSMVVPSAT